jgi:demethylmenaquinone methyltransferase/2-methoxy-6-polyprenyl-1,4-benzoquinol methylase
VSSSEDRLRRYYADRAAEYEKIYEKPERQADLQTIEKLLGSAFPGEQVLEVACGTGYWTRSIAKSASAVFATDCNEEVLEIARRKSYAPARVEFAAADAFVLGGVPAGCTAGFHAFWWSHVPVGQRDRFLRTFHGRLPAGAPVVMLDNVFFEGSSTPIARKDAEGNTYQIRTLQDGSRHEILKNFPSEADLHADLRDVTTNLDVQFLQYFWIARYMTR